MPTPEEQKYLDDLDKKALAEWDQRMSSIHNSSQVDMEILDVDTDLGKVGDMPVKLITRDLPKANLMPEDMSILLEEFSIASDLVDEKRNNGEDFKGTLRDIMMQTRSIINLSRGFLAHGTFWAKTQGNFTGDISQMIEQRKAIQEIMNNPKLRKEMEKQTGKSYSGMEDKVIDFGRNYNLNQSNELKMINKGGYY